MVKRAFWARFLILIVIASALYGDNLSAEEGKCRLKLKTVGKSQMPHNAIFAYAQQYVPAVKGAKPESLRDLPAGIGGDVLYYSAKVSNKEIWAVRETSSESEIYIDTNGDGKLSDERGFAAMAVKSGWWWNRKIDYYLFGPVTIGFGNAENKVKVSFNLISDPRGRSLRVYPVKYRSGEIKLDQNIYKVVVVDGNYDGRYDSKLSLPVENLRDCRWDSFAIDLNGDGIWNLEYYQFSEVMPLTKLVKIRDVYYSIDITPDGSVLELKKAAPEFGTLDIGGMDIKLKLWSDMAEQYLVGSTKEWKLPAGNYKAIHVILTQSDSQANKWVLRSSGNMGKLGNFQIQPNDKTSFKIGAPILVRSVVSPSRKKNTVRIGIALEGPYGEEYSAKVTKNSVTLSAPKFKIVDETGNELVSDSFAYG